MWLLAVAAGVALKACKAGVAPLMRLAGLEPCNVGLPLVLLNTACAHAHEMIKSLTACGPLCAICGCCALHCWLPTPSLSAQHAQNDRHDPDASYAASAAVAAAAATFAAVATAAARPDSHTYTTIHHASLRIALCMPVLGT